MSIEIETRSSSLAQDQVLLAGSRNRFHGQ